LTFPRLSPRSVFSPISSSPLPGSFSLHLPSFLFFFFKLHFRFFSDHLPSRIQSEVDPPPIAPSQRRALSLTFSINFPYTRPLLAPTYSILLSPFFPRVFTRPCFFRRKPSSLPSDRDSQAYPPDLPHRTISLPSPLGTPGFRTTNSRDFSPLRPKLWASVFDFIRAPLY